MNSDMIKLRLHAFFHFSFYASFFIFALLALQNVSHTCYFVGYFFVLPFFLTSIHAGVLADHHSKSHLLIIVSCLEIISLLVSLGLLWISLTSSLVTLLIMMSILFPIFIITNDAFSFELYEKKQRFGLIFLYFLSFVTCSLLLQAIVTSPITMSALVILYSSLIVMALINLSLSIFIPASIPMSFSKKKVIFALFEAVIALIEMKRVPKLRPLFVVEILLFFLLGLFTFSIFVNRLDLIFMLDFFLLGVFFGFIYYYFLISKKNIRWSPIFALAAAVSLGFMLFPTDNITLRVLFTLLFGFTLVQSYLHNHKEFVKISLIEYRCRNLGAVYFYGILFFFLPLALFHRMNIATPFDVFLFGSFSIAVVALLLFAALFSLKPRKLATF